MRLHRPDGPPLSPLAPRVAELLREAENGLTLPERHCRGELRRIIKDGTTPSSSIGTDSEEQGGAA
jgi:hypothetical protein